MSRKIAVLGTGMVGQTIGKKMIELGYEVMMGSRTADNEKAATWVKECGPDASQGTFAQAAQFADIAFNCTKGMHCLEILAMAGEQNLDGKILIDLSNPLDFTRGFPPTLTLCNDNSLGEEIQREFPRTRVVKALNTMNCNIMVNTSLVNKGDHDVFICGNDAEAKKACTDLLVEMGWSLEHVFDLGDITNSRGTEQLLPLWVRLMGVVGSPMFQFKIVR